MVVWVRWMVKDFRLIKFGWIVIVFFFLLFIVVKLVVRDIVVVYLFCFKCIFFVDGVVFGNLIGCFFGVKFGLFLICLWLEMGWDNYF